MSPCLSQKVAAADERHRVRVTFSRAECSHAQTQHLPPDQPIDELQRSNAVADADRECARADAESTRIRDSDIDAAFAEHRARPEFVGASR